MNGLLPECSKGARLEVWLHSACRRPWARAHVARRHKVAPGAVVILRLLVNRSLLTRRGRGLWTSSVAIPPSAFMAVTLPSARPAVAQSV
jgi:hypothetical protein